MDVLVELSDAQATEPKATDRHGAAPAFVADPGPRTEEIESFPLERPRIRGRHRLRGSTTPSLSHFVAGPENRLAAFLGRWNEDLFAFGNPLLLVGPTGVGKSTLAMHFSARAAIARGSDSGPGSVICLAAVDFARRYAEAIDSDDLSSLRDEIDHADVLVIEDLQLVNHKPAAQDELALRIERRTALEYPSILTSRRLPSEVRGMRPMLVSRVLTGLTVPIQPPNRLARQLLLREYSLLHGLDIDPVLLRLLEDGLEAGLSPRQLDAAIKQIELWSRMNDSRPTLEAVESALDSVGRSQAISLAAITQATARQFRLKSSELKSSSRRQNLVRARSLAMYLARRLTTESLNRIGDHFGGRDHSTVLHAIRKTEATIEDDGELRRAADDVIEKLSAG